MATCPVRLSTNQGPWTYVKDSWWVAKPFDVEISYYLVLLTVCCLRNEDITLHFIPIAINAKGVKSR